MKRFAVILGGLILTKCTTGVVFTNDDPSASIQGLLNDRYECLQEASSNGSSVSGRANSTSATISGSSGLTCSSSAFRACLAARGWLRNDGAVGSNAFTVPSGATVSCNR